MELNPDSVTVGPQFLGQGNQSMTFKTIAVSTGSVIAGLIVCPVQMAQSDLVQ
jgi:hypothetical protein